MIVRFYIGMNPTPPPEDFEVDDSKEAASLFEYALATAEVGVTLHVIATAIEEGP